MLNWEQFVSDNIKGTKGIVILYDLTNAETLNWVSQRIQIIKENLDHVPPLLLVGDKGDLEDKRDISEEQVDQIKSIHKLTSSIEISLQTGENVEETFIKLTEMMISKIKTDYKLKIQRVTFLKEHKRLAFLLFLSIIGTVFLLSWFMFYLIYVLE